MLRTRLALLAVIVALTAGGVLALRHYTRKLAVPASTRGEASASASPAPSEMDIAATLAKLDQPRRLRLLVIDQWQNGGGPIGKVAMIDVGADDAPKAPPRYFAVPAGPITVRAAEFLLRSHVAGLPLANKRLLIWRELVAGGAASPIDTPDQIPQVYRAVGSAHIIEHDAWSAIWDELTAATTQKITQPATRATTRPAMTIRPLAITIDNISPDKLYTLALDDGRLVCRTQPMSADWQKYRDALKQRKNGVSH